MSGAQGAAVRPSPSPRPSRETALWPYVEKLRAWSDLRLAMGDTAGDSRIHVGEQALVVADWERRLLEGTFLAEAEEIPRHARHVLQGLALLTKCLDDLDRLRLSPDSADDIYRVQAELMLDSVIGRALAREIGMEIESLEAAGEREHIGELSGFQEKMHRGVKIATRGIAEAEREMAELRTRKLQATAQELDQLSEEIDEAAPGQAPVRRRTRTEELEELDPAEELRRAHAAERQARLEALRRRQARLRAALPSRTGTEVLAFVCAAALWALVVVLPVWRARPLPAVGPEAFTYRTAQQLSGVRALPPALYATVRADAWSAMTELERKGLIEEIGDRIAVVGYQGAVVTDETGRPLARWLRKRGAHLVRRDELSGPPEGPGALPGDSPTGESPDGADFPEKNAP